MPRTTCSRSYKFLPGSLWDRQSMISPREALSWWPGMAQRTCSAAWRGRSRSSAWRTCSTTRACCWTTSRTWFTSLLFHFFSNAEKLWILRAGCIHILVVYKFAFKFLSGHVFSVQLFVCDWLSFKTDTVDFDKFSLNVVSRVNLPCHSTRKQIGKWRKEIELHLAGIKKRKK